MLQPPSVGLLYLALLPNLREELTAVRKIVDAEDSDLFDVLAYIAFALDPITREVTWSTG